MSTNDSHDETGLRERFALLRAADRARVPGFDRVLHARPARTGIAWATAALAAVAGLALFALWRAPRDDAGAMPEIMLHVAAEMPSDFLLEPTVVDVRRDAPTLLLDPNEEVPFL